MRFHSEHRFDGSEQAVAAILADPAFYLSLALPDLNQPVVVEERKDGNYAVLRLRYAFVGTLDPVACRLLGSNQLTWIQEVRVDQKGGTLRFEAENDPKRLHGAADFILTQVGGETIRSLEGELVVAVPVIGRTAERRIVPGLLHRLDIEAQTLNDRLSGV